MSELPILDPRHPRYESLIPRGAAEQVLSASDKYPLSRTVEYLLNNEIVGEKRWDIEGQLAYEIAFKDGHKHERRWAWYETGKLTFAEELVDGLPHGIAIQYRRDGSIMGTYSMEHGTGIDIWRNDSTGKTTIAEVKYFVAGGKHGYEWWIHDDQKRVFIERHWKRGKLHGIEREWQEDRLEPDFPKFFLEDKEISRAEYVNVAALDASLPVYKAKDDNPERKFPPEISVLMKQNE